MSIEKQNMEKMTQAEKPERSHEAEVAERTMAAAQKTAETVANRYEKNGDKATARELHEAQERHKNIEFSPGYEFAQKANGESLMHIAQAHARDGKEAGHYVDGLTQSMLNNPENVQGYAKEFIEEDNDNLLQKGWKWTNNNKGKIIMAAGIVAILYGKGRYSATTGGGWKDLGAEGAAIFSRGGVDQVKAIGKGVKGELTGYKEAITGGKFGETFVRGAKETAKGVIGNATKQKETGLQAAWNVRKDVGSQFSNLADVIKTRGDELGKTKEGDRLSFADRAQQRQEQRVARSAEGVGTGVTDSGKERFQEKLDRTLKKQLHRQDGAGDNVDAQAVKRIENLTFEDTKAQLDLDKAKDRLDQAQQKAKGLSSEQLEALREITTDHGIEIKPDIDSKTVMEELTKKGWKNDDDTKKYIDGALDAFKAQQEHVDAQLAARDAKQDLNLVKQEAVAQKEAVLELAKDEPEGGVRGALNQTKESLNTLNPWSEENTWKREEKGFKKKLKNIEFVKNNLKNIPKEAEDYMANLVQEEIKRNPDQDIGKLFFGAVAQLDDTNYALDETQRRIMHEALDQMDQNAQFLGPLRSKTAQLWGKYMGAVGVAVALQNGMDISSRVNHMGSATMENIQEMFYKPKQRADIDTNMEGVLPTFTEEEAKQLVAQAKAGDKQTAQLLYELYGIDVNNFQM